jgi:hypothetical protein
MQRGLVLALLATGCGAASTSSPSFDRTVGLACTSNAQCDVTGTGRNACSSTALTTLPTPVCVGLSCTPGTGSTPAPCDDGRGACVNTGSGHLCLPACAFGNGGGATGCAGKARCEPTSVATTAGTGYCAAACTADADCHGLFCQVETGQCVAAHAAYSKSVGSLCTNLDVTNGTCLCQLGVTSNSGYCTSVCTTGAASCTAGFSCDPGLSASYSSMPSGLFGLCLKNCATNLDCSGLGSSCVQDGGGVSMVCKPY